MVRSYASVSLVCLIACGSPDPVDDTDVEPLSDCAVGVAFSGGYTGAVDAEDSVACLNAFAGDTGVWMTFVPIEGDVASFEIDVADVTAGGTGAFPATASLRLDDDRRWAAADCGVEVDEHSYVDERDGVDAYLFVGTGSCAAPAVSEGDGEVEIAPFTFRFVSHWFQ